MSHKSFNLADNCIYTILDQNNGTASDLRLGEKVTVTYQDAHGVLIANHVQQDPLRFEGTVKAVDPGQQTLTLHRRGLDKQLNFADGCKTVLHGNQPGTLANLQPGDHVTVTYETPGGVPTARKIAQTRVEFTGTLTAIDLGEKTLKANAVFGSKKFNVADNCAILIHGQPGGKLSDLRPDEKLVFNYDEINGINVVNRIAPAAAQSHPLASTTPMTGD